MTPTTQEYQAALDRGHAKALEVAPVFDRLTERTAYQVVNPGHSVHTVRVTEAGVLSCDCASRKYCCCRAVVHELLTAQAEAREAKIAEARRQAEARRTAMPAISNAAISIFR